MAPTNGMNAARNTSTAIGTTNGSPRISAPRPMPVASMSATMICTRTYWPTECQAARPPPSIAARARFGARRVSQRQTPAPSIRKNRVRNSDSTRPTAMSPTVEAPVSAPDSRVLALLCTHFVTESIALCTSDAGDAERPVAERGEQRLVGGLAVRVWMSPRPDRTVSVTSVMSAASTIRSVRNVAATASPFGQRCRDQPELDRVDQAGDQDRDEDRDHDDVQQDDEVDRDRDEDQHPDDRPGPRPGDPDGDRHGPRDAVLRDLGVVHALGHPAILGRRCMHAGSTSDGVRGHG